MVERTWEKVRNLTFCEVRPTGRLMMSWRGSEKVKKMTFKMMRSCPRLIRMKESCEIASKA